MKHNGLMAEKIYVACDRTRTKKMQMSSSFHSASGTAVTLSIRVGHRSEDGLSVQTLSSLLLRSPAAPQAPGGPRDAGWQAQPQATPAVSPVTLPQSAGARGAGPQREPPGGAGAQDHGDGNHGDRGGVWGVELAIPDLPGPLVLLQLLHPVPQQVHSDAAGGGAQHAG